MNEYMRRYYQLNKDELKLYHKTYYSKNKEKASITNKEYWIKNRKTLLIKNRNRYIQNKKEYAESKRLYHKRTYYELKYKALKYYGGGQIECNCCGESTFEFLTIDHINNDGKEHRKKIGTTTIYRWLKINNYPIGFRTLCFNCNLGKQINKGKCPHEHLKNMLPIMVTWRN